MTMNIKLNNMKTIKFKGTENQIENLEELFKFGSNDLPIKVADNEKKKTDHNKLYHEKGRNGWTPSTTIDDIADVNPVNPKMFLNKEDLKGSFALDLLKVTREITELLITKNKAYGNTALNPTNIFSKLSATEAICARLDDKIARIKNKGINDETEDTVDDLIGYLLLLKMSMNEKE